MIILLTGASHVGKTLLAQRMLEKYNYPYLSIDHLKMGLIRGGYTELTPEDEMPKYYFDAVLPLAYHSLDLAEEFASLEPFGKGNPKPLFATKNVEISRAKVLGKNANVVRFTLKEESIGKSYNGLIFGDADIFLGEVAEKFGQDVCEDLLAGRGSINVDIMYYPDINEYNGNKSLQFIIEHYRF